MQPAADLKRRLGVKRKLTQLSRRWRLDEKNHLHGTCPISVEDYLHSVSTQLDFLGHAVSFE